METVDRNPIKKVFSRVGLAAGLFMLVHQVAVFVINYTIYSVAPHLTESGWYLWLLSYLPLYLIAFPVFLLVIRTIPDTTGGPGQTVIPSAGQVVLLLVICWGVVFPLNLLSTGLATLVAHLLGGEAVNGLGEVVLNSSPWANLLIVGIIAPIMEEIIFRGILYKKLIAFGGKVYVLVSAMIFALFHANIYQLLYAFVLGLLFAGLTYYAGTIRYSLILHLAVNLMGSGGNTFIYFYGGELAMGIYGAAIAVVGIVGLILAVVAIIRHRHRLHFEPGLVPLPDKRVVILNPGMLFYVILVSCFIITGLLAPMFELA